MMSDENQIQHEIKLKLDAIEKLARECRLLMSNSIEIPEAPVNKTNDVFFGPTQFQMNVRAFVKKYGRGMSGPQKFVLLLSYMAKGNKNVEISLLEIKKVWNKMTAAPLLGIEYHPSFPNRGIEYGWINSSKRGMFNLEDAWQEIFSKSSSNA